MPGLRQNPPYSRFEYIAKQYGDRYPGVVIDTFTLLSDTVGIENPENEYSWVRPAWMRVPLPGRFTHEPISIGQQRVLLQEALDDLMQDTRMFGGRDSDALWPWIAKELARVYKTMPDDYGDLRNRALGKGSALALWQKQERIDLGRWKLGQALQALENFVIEQDVPQGKVIYEFPDGWTVQRLWSQAELEAEGDVMQHCVAQYAGDVVEGHTEIFSLRDPQGRPHATLEFRESLNRFVQIQGKQNRDPKPEYMQRVEAFRKAQGYAEMGLSEKERAQFVRHGYNTGQRGWDEDSTQAGFSITESVDADAEPDVDTALDELPKLFPGASYIDFEAASLLEEAEDAIREGIYDGWSDKHTDAMQELESAVNDVVSEYEDEEDEEFIVEEAIARSGVTASADKEWIEMEVKGQVF